MAELKHHFWKNKSWVVISLETMFIGIAFLLRSNQLDEHVTVWLSWTDDVVPGLIYLIVGILLLVNALWDFYRHYIRLVLITVTGGLWLLITVAYMTDALVTHRVEIFPFIATMITVNVMLGAYVEPPYKLKGGD
jgi:Na+/melibiose symporter-like transporter